MFLTGGLTAQNVNFQHIRTGASYRRISAISVLSWAIFVVWTFMCAGCKDTFSPVYMPHTVDGIDTSFIFYSHCFYIYL